ncbi:hypothetical protein VTL71DRAFT_4269 [Oculimacula yallundae]|uniref:Secreted protein n=1 Tax=Oculimacula yallundae TaxID=86028 RepID=A0ABR4C5D3_9HELO
MPRFLLFLILAAETEVAPVGSPASIKQIRRSDDGHESSRLPGSFVQLWKNGARQTLDHCLVIEKLKPPPRQITSLTTPGGTVPPGQA